MEICGENHLQDYSKRIHQSSIADYKTADDCDCEFIKPVSGFECQLCNIFLRNGNKIKEHIKSFQHMKIYEIHLQEHIQHQHDMNTSRNHINAHKPAEPYTANRNDDMRECNAARSDLKHNLANDYSQLERSDHEGSTTETNRKRSGLNGVIKRLRESGTRNRPQNVIDNTRVTVINGESETRNRTQNVIDNTRVTVINDESGTRNRTQKVVDITRTTVLNDKLTLQNVNEHFNRNQGEHCSDLVGVQRSKDNVATDNLCESISAQRSEDLSERCRTLKEIEQEGTLEGRLLKSEDNDVVNINLNAKMSTTTEHGGVKENGEMGVVMNASLEGEPEGARQAGKIKEEECDGDDVDDDGGVIGGFLEDSNDVLHNQNEYYNGEIMPGYKIDHESQTISTISCSKQMSTISTSAADSSVRAEETCTVTTSVSQNPWPSFVSLDNERRQRFSKNVAAENSENDGDVNSNLNRSGDTISSVKELMPSRYHSSHRRISEKLLSCFVCGKFFTQSGDLKKHERVHTGEKPYSCDFCGMQFATSGNCDRHKRIHTGERPYSCDICGKAFKQRQNVNIHKRIHFGNKPLSCEFCGKEFKKMSSYEFHIMTHTGEKPFSCNICEKSFKSNRYLELHQVKHASVKPLSCTVCAKSFMHASILRAHERIHTGEKPYSCDKCEMTFARSNNCTRHKRTHTREKPYWCNECGKLFNDQEALRVHLRVHTGDRPFTCNVCGHLFKDQGNLEVHERIHTGEIPFTCDVCGQSFQQAVALERHQSIHENECTIIC